MVGNDEDSTDVVEVGTYPLSYNVGSGDEGTGPLDVQGAVGTGVQEAEMIGTNDEDVGMAGTSVICTGLPDGRTGPSITTEGPCTGTGRKPTVQRSMLDYVRPNMNMRGSENEEVRGTDQDMRWKMSGT